jgi:hypothetical protein
MPNDAIADRASSQCTYLVADGQHKVEKHKGRSCTPIESVWDIELFSGATGLFPDDAKPCKAIGAP